MIRYYKLFDLLARRNMKKSDLRKILSSKTIAKLSKGEYISGEVTEKICKFLHCQPGDIMEYIERKEYDKNTIMQIVPQISGKDYISYFPKKEIEKYEKNEYRLNLEYTHSTEKE